MEFLGNTFTPFAKVLDGLQSNSSGSFAPVLVSDAFAAIFSVDDGVTWLANGGSVSLSGSTVNVHVAHVSSSNITQVRFDSTMVGPLPSFAGLAALTNGSSMFLGSTGITGVFDASVLTSLSNGSSMFNGCSGLTGVTGAASLTALANGFSMFRDCSSLTGTFDASGLTALTNGSSMFRDCSGLTGTFDASGLTALTNGSSMLRGCSGLTGVTGAASLTALTNGNLMFNACSGLTGTFDASGLTALTNGSSMFNGCSSLTGVTGTASLTALPDGFSMFRNCSSLAGTFDASGLIALTNGSSMFRGCSSLAGVTGLSGVTCTSWDLAFNDCGSFSSAAVDLILSDLVTAGQSNGTLGLAGSTPPPTSAGLASAVTLTARGWTVSLPPPTISISEISGDDQIDVAEATSVVISGATAGVEDGQIVTVTIVDAVPTQVFTDTATVASDAWSLTADLSASLAFDGSTYTVRADVSDAADNAATQATRSIVTFGLSGLVNIPLGQQSAVVTAATAAAAGQAYLPQDVIDEVAKTEWLDFLPVSNNLLTAGSADAALGESIDSIRSVTSSKTFTLTVGDGVLKTATGITATSDRYGGVMDRGNTITFVVAGANLVHTESHRFLSISPVSPVTDLKIFEIDNTGQLRAFISTSNNFVDSGVTINNDPHIVSWDINNTTVDFRVDTVISNTINIVAQTGLEVDIAAGYLGGRSPTSTSALVNADVQGSFYFASDGSSDIDVEMIERFANSYYGVGI